MDSPLLPRCSPETGVRPHETPDPCLAGSHCRRAVVGDAASNRRLRSAVAATTPSHDLAGLPDRKGRRSAAFILHLARLRQVLDHLNKGANPMKLTLKSVGNA